MLITKTVEVVINSSNKKHYLDLGYNVKNKQKINIPIEHLTKGSNVFVDCICDICNKPKKVKYIRFLQNIEKYNIFSCSHKCSNIKRQKTCLEKYGVDIVSKSSEIKEKIKETCLEKYGVESFSKTEEFQEKIKKTCLEKYGDEHPQRLESIKQKSKNTCLDKYGVVSPQKNKDIRVKSEKTCLEKYNTKYYIETNDFKEKSKKSKIEKYGTTNLMLLDEIKNKIKETNKERYGVEYPYQSKEIMLKIFNNNMEKYGFVNVSLNHVVREKMNNTRKINRINEIENLIDIDYINNIYTLKCDCGEEHNFNIKYNTYKNRKTYGIKMCTICNYTKKSGKEMELLKFIKENYDGEIIENSRNIIEPYELDIYLPELNLAFEFNGLWWHNELYKEKNYHRNKTESCLEKGIQLVCIWEDDWNYKQEIVKSMILNKLGKTPNKIFARKCEIKEVTDTKLVRNFLIKNHIQGFVGSSVKLGLFYENELVSLMTFGKKRKFMNSSSKNDGEFELLRFCTKLNMNVIGGASKLFKYFIKNYNYNEITTYADRSHSQGKLYMTLGFNFISKTPPNYYYVIDGMRRHRFGFRKDVLVKEGYDPNKTEIQIMAERNLYRIFDSGSMKFSIEN